jgi:hypothetical protein
VQAASYQPVCKPSTKLNWLPYQSDKVKTDANVRPVQYTDSEPANRWTAPSQTPTPAVRPTPGAAQPPRTLDDVPTEPKASLLPAPPSELDNRLTSPPSEPAVGSDAMPSLPNNSADSTLDVRTAPNDRDSIAPRENAGNNGIGPNAPGGLSGNNLPGRRSDKGKGDSDFNCMSVKDLKPITKIGTDITIVQGEVPKDCPWGDEDKFAPRSWSSLTFTWTASALCHKPLYFEDVKLERYGHMWGPWLQPIISHARFFALVPALPYEMGLEPPNECMYALGYYRPGDCAPYYLDPIPLSVRATAFEGAVITGGILIFP